MKSKIAAAVSVALSQALTMSCALAQGHETDSGMSFDDAFEIVQRVTSTEDGGAPYFVEVPETTQFAVIKSLTSTSAQNSSASGASAPALPILRSSGVVPNSSGPGPQDDYSCAGVSGNPDPQNLFDTWLLATPSGTLAYPPNTANTIGLQWKWKRHSSLGKYGCIYVSYDNQAPTVVSCEKDGHTYNTSIPWIVAGHTYVFGLVVQNFAGQNLNVNKSWFLSAACINAVPSS